jgi:hypothetical protein
MSAAMRDALAEAIALHELGIGMELIVIACQTGKIGDVTNIDGAPARGHCVAQPEVFKELRLRIAV